MGGTTQSDNFLGLSDQYRVALVRGVYSGLVLGASAFVITYGQGAPFKVAALAGVGVALSTLATRTGVEGTIDTQRAK